MHCSRRLIVQTLVFSHSYLHRQVSPPETLVVKGGTTWTRNGRWILPDNARLPRNIQGSFTRRKSTTWDKRLYFRSEGRRTEDFFRPEKSDGFGRVWTRELGYQRPARYLLITEAAFPKDYNLSSIRARKISNANISFARFVCLSVRPFAWTNSAATGLIFTKFYIWVFFSKRCQ